MRACCEDERVMALAARDALVRLLAQGSVGVTGVGQDKYGGRVDADVSTAGTRRCFRRHARWRFCSPLFRRQAAELVRLN